jgi:putative ABC transport system permease protein
VSHQMMFWRMLFAAMIRRRSRAVMAVVSSAVGAATMFCLMAVCLAVPAQMSAEIRQFGANLVVVPVAAGDAHAEITSPQGDAIVGVVTRDVPARSAGYRYENVRINRTPYLLAGIEVSQAESLNRHWDVDGRWPQAGEALVGVDVAQATGLQVGSVVTIEQVASDSLTGTSTSSANARQVQLRVAGIVQTGAEEDAIVYTTVADVAALTQQERGWDVVEFSVDTSAVSMDQVIAEVLASDATVSARPVSKITTADTRIISMLTTLFWVVSIVVLTLTLVGVSTTMTVIVSERRQEIGLRKALGASNRDIAREFRTEAIAYGLVGGIVGTAIGYGLAQIVSLGVFNRAVGFEPLMALGSVLVAALVAALAAFSPVRRASRFEPAVVLRED